MRHYEQCLAALAATSLDPADKHALLALVDDFVFGHLLRASEARAHGGLDGEAVAAMAEFARAQLQTGRYPHLQALLGDAAPRDAAEQIAGLGIEEDRFEQGLQVLLDGAAIRWGLSVDDG
jgi:hypothetical protein